MHKDSLLPSSIGLIPDGTRRWAHQSQCTYTDAYIRTMLGITNFISFMFDQSISSLSVYLLSKENLLRKPSDLEPVLTSELDLLMRMLPPVVAKFKAKVFHAGRKDLLPPNYAEALSTLCQYTADNAERRLYLLAVYNPLEELMGSFKHIGHQHIKIEDLWVPEALDLVIRTGGEHRLSNFLPLQAGYAEYIFIEKYFNDLTEQDLLGFLNEFQIRHRRYGR